MDFSIVPESTYERSVGRKYQEIDGVVTAMQASVNDTTALQAPSVPVKQIGKVLPRLLQYMPDTPVGLHILFSKLDVNDGFWRLILQGTDCYKFAYMLLQVAGKLIQIVVPLAVQMGWVESPSLSAPSRNRPGTWLSTSWATKSSFPMIPLRS